MKLTKGKISKIQNKKKQSLKRYKKGGKTHKSKTFRKRRAFNLHNKSLKKYKGGQPVETEAKSDGTPNLAEKPTTDVEGAPSPTVAPTTDVEATPVVEEPVKSDEIPTPVVPTSDVEATQVEEEPVKSNVVGEESLGSDVEEPDKTNATPPPVVPTSDVEETPVGEESLGTNVDATPVGEESLGTDVDATRVGEEEDPGEGPGSGSALPPPISAEGSLDADNLSNNADDSVGTNVAAGSEGEQEASVEGEQEASVEGEQENQPSMTENTPAGNDISIVAESLSKLADYISEKIAQKLKNLSFGSSSGSGSDLNRDSFNAVANANETLAESA
jgi:hypothetical protein